MESINYKPGDTFLLDEYEAELCITNKAVVTKVTDKVIHWKCETIFDGWKHSGTSIKKINAST